MTTVDPEAPEGRPGNPARALEKYAVAVVSCWVGTRGAVIDTSEGHEPDFRVNYSDGRTAIGEVGWHEEPELAAMWGNTLKRDRPQQIALPAGYGQWGLGLRLGANIRNLHKGLPAAIRLLRERGVGRVEMIADDWPRGEVAAALRALGVTYINCVSLDEPANAVFFMPAGGGTSGDDPNVIADWFSMVLGDPRYADTTEKLLSRDADERHVFLMTGGLTPFVADDNLRRFVGLPLPTKAPDVPSGITHVWGICRFGGQVAALWMAQGGWSVVSLPDAD